MNPDVLKTQKEIDEEQLNTAFVTIREFATLISETIKHNHKYSLDLSVRMACEDMNKHPDFGKIVLFALTNESKDLIQWANTL